MHTPYSRKETERQAGWGAPGSRQRTWDDHGSFPLLSQDGPPAPHLRNCRCFLIVPPDPLRVTLGTRLRDDKTGF